MYVYVYIKQRVLDSRTWGRIRYVSLRCLFMVAYFFVGVFARYSDRIVLLFFSFYVVVKEGNWFVCWAKE